MSVDGDRRASTDVDAPKARRAKDVDALGVNGL